MAIYKLVKDPLSGKTDGVMKTISTTDDGGHRYLCIPFCPDNIDYQEYLSWVSDGNTADPAD